MVTYELAGVTTREPNGNFKTLKGLVHYLQICGDMFGNITVYFDDEPYAWIYYRNGKIWNA